MNQTQTITTESNELTLGRGDIGLQRSGMYCYDGKFWVVPKDYRFPTNMNLRNAWGCWIKNLARNKAKDRNGELIAGPIPPFRNISRCYLPKKQGLSFRSHICPVLKMMCLTNKYRLMTAKDLAYATEFTIDRLYTAGFEVVKSRASFLFVNDRYRKWGVSTYYNYVKSSYIKKHGSDDDIAKLSDFETRNRLLTI